MEIREVVGSIWKIDESQAIPMKPASSNLHNKDMIIHAGSIRPNNK